MAKPVTFKFRFIGSDGKDYTQPVKAFLQENNLLGLEKKLDHRFDIVWDRIREQKETIIELLKDKLRPGFLMFLDKNPDIKTRDLHKYIGNTGRAISEFSHLALWRLYEDLEKDGVLIPTSHGAGKNRTWRLKETGLG